LLGRERVLRRIERALELCGTPEDDQGAGQ